MSYGDSEGPDLYYGDLLVDFFDQYNNMVNPPSDAGWFLYLLFGKAMDEAMETINQMLLNLDPITCQSSYLEIIAQEFKLKRDSSWSDNYWRAVLISYYYNLETITGIEFVLNQISSYYNWVDGVEREQIIVEYFRGLYDGFICSDKWDSYAQCSDKWDTLDTIGTQSGERFVIHFGNNPSNGIIEDLLNIIEDGGI